MYICINISKYIYIYRYYVFEKYIRHEKELKHFASKWTSYFLRPWQTSGIIPESSYHKKYFENIPILPGTWHIFYVTLKNVKHTLDYNHAKKSHCFSIDPIGGPSFQVISKSSSDCAAWKMPSPTRTNQCEGKCCKAWRFWPNGIIFHQPRFPWNSRGFPLLNHHLGEIGRVRSL